MENIGKARDLDGNTWNARRLNEKEKTRLEGSSTDYLRNGARNLILLDGGASGIAFHKGVPAQNARYYGGLEYDRGEEEISIDGERYIAWIWGNLIEAYQDWCDERGRDYDFDKEDTNVWMNYLAPLEDAYYET